MNSVVSYFLGIVTILILLFVFWYIASINGFFNKYYKESICYKICQSDSKKD